MYCLIIIFCLAISNANSYYDFNNITLHPNWPRNDDAICGKPSSFRIIGGEDAVLGEFPYIARLGYSG